MIDNIGRKIDYLRISVTDRCNLRCVYCMPEEGIDLLSHDDILRFDEILRVVKSCAKLGIENIRITGGEPLVRKNIPNLIREIKGVEGIKEVSITTNGVYLPEYIDELVDAGLDRINISLDTLDREKFMKVTRMDVFHKVKRGIILALEKGISCVKLNVVTMKEVNITEVIEFVTLTEKYPIHIRFIELMPIGLGGRFTTVENDKVKEIIEKEKELISCKEVVGLGPASYYKIPNAKGTIGFISPMSHEFCNRCNRVRLTSEGFLKLCLHWNLGIDLKEKLREGISDEKLKEVIYTAIKDKPQHHEFKSVKENKQDKNSKYDNRSMFQIGG
ncbi:GTP 3',8-cyclase MoaA [Clostridium niameyense]|uniref:GTP 3',8-cyclase n=1 Tax=Clostridium niameyense TaxID=1622073 RepID=A0A6M0RB14_9CLOT|nr:GTP 3',8-cyclase MoaA [Clostridium niameyense]